MYKGLIGPRALLLAVVDRAAKDALRDGVAGTLGTDHDVADARAYFADGRYKHDLDLLGLPVDVLPAAILEEADVEAG